LNERAVLEQRLVTLTSLLETPGGPLGDSGGVIGARLQETWSTERRLIERILAEAQGDDVWTTVEAWHRRTTEFIRRSGDDDPQWTDRHGHQWDAQRVLDLLVDIQERLEGWTRPDETPSDAEPPSPPGAAPEA
jgi:hypothetical protein